MGAMAITMERLSLTHLASSDQQNGPVSFLKYVAALFTVVAALTSPLALGADWSISKGIDFAVDYSDNSNFEVSDNAVESTIANVSPYIRAIGVGNRSTVALSSNLNFRKNFEDSSEEVIPTAAINTNTNLVSDIVTLRTGASVRQQSANIELALEETLAESSRLRRTYNYSINPVADLQIDTSSNLVLQYAVRGREVEDEEATTVNQTAQFSYVKTPRHSGYGWGLNGEYQRTENVDTDTRAEVKSLIAVLGLSNNSSTLFSLGIGREWVVTPDNDETDSSAVYDFGLLWRPRSWVDVDLGYTLRAFSDYPRAAIRIIGSNKSISLNWSQDYSRNVISTTVLGTGVEDDNITDPIESDQVADAILLSEGLFVDERFDLQFLLNGRVSTFSATASYLRRDDLDSNLETELVGGRITFTRTLGRNVIGRATYLHRRDLGGTDTPVLRENGIGISLSMAF